MVAGTESAVLMVESEAKELSEDQMLGAVLFGHDEMQIAIQAIKEFAAAVGAVESTWVAPVKMKSFGKLKDAFEAKISEAYTIAVKQDRYAALDASTQKLLLSSFLKMMKLALLMKLTNYSKI